MTDPWVVLGWVLVSGLACHRVWRMVAVDSVFDRVRAKVVPQSGFVHDLIDCPWCLPFHFHLAVGAVLWGTGTLGAVGSALVVLGGSTVTGVIGRGD